MAVGVVAPWGKWTGLDNDGHPAANGFLYTYVAGTSTELSTYSDVGLTTANANPVLLDASGRATVFLTPVTSYKFILKNALGTTLWTQDNITVAAADATVFSLVAGDGIALTETGPTPGTGDVTVAATGVFTGDVVLPSTKRIYLDGGGDTYLLESSANAVQIYCGGALAVGIAVDGMAVQPTKKFYLDGGGSGANTYLDESSADIIRLVAGGAANLTVTATTITINGQAVSFGANGSATTGYRTVMVPNT